MLSIAALRSIHRQTWSGHNHTEFCPHGSGEDVERYIRQAIACGFKTYSVTEHFPLPQANAQPLQGHPHSIATAAMLTDELPQYFAKLNYLKAKYHHQIRILVGFEIDYIAAYSDWLADQLAIYHRQIDDAILSVHFLPTPAGLCALDDSAPIFQQGVLQAYGSPLNVTQAYLATVQQAVNWQVPYKPHRYGHLLSYYQWSPSLPDRTIWEDSVTHQKLTTILNTIQANGELINCRLSQPAPATVPFNWIQTARQSHIPLVFDANAHCVNDVATGYASYLQALDYL